MDWGAEILDWGTQVLDWGAQIQYVGTQSMDVDAQVLDLGAQNRRIECPNVKLGAWCPEFKDARPDGTGVWSVNKKINGRLKTFLLRRLSAPK